MKRLLIPAAIVFLFLVAAGAAFAWWSIEIQPVSSNTSLQDFLIVKGTSAGQMGNELVKAKLIRSSLAFRIYVQITGNQRKIQAGAYRLSPSYSLGKAVGELLKGPVEVWVTIPEGFRREEIAERFITVFNLKEPDSFRKEFLTASQGKEGFLFPDTYLFPRTASASAVVSKMLSIFDKRVDEKMKGDISKSGYTLSQVVTMASIVERETKTDEERPIVAGILYKRLKIGMPLQVDATVQYVVATTGCQSNPRCEWWPITTPEERAINSPFNTYKYRGLPPSPIANPGLSSLMAAIYPQDSPYLYYLHDKNGVIHYAKTLEEHNQNIRIYLEK